MLGIPNHLIPDRLARELETHDFICGSDEAGYGAWAGPLVVCAVVVPRTWLLEGLTDSKKLSATVRERLYATLVKTVPHYMVEVTPEEIDAEGVGKAWPKAHEKAIQGALDAHKGEQPLVIVDGNRSFSGATALPKADLLIPAVSAASVLAKVHRDRIMREMDLEYPGYAFKSHVGYGTQKHRAALERLGVTPIHRKSYSPISSMVVNPEAPDIMELLDSLE